MYDPVNQLHDKGVSDDNCAGAEPRPAVHPEPVAPSRRYLPRADHRPCHEQHRPDQRLRRPRRDQRCTNTETPLAQRHSTSRRSSIDQPIAGSAADANVAIVEGVTRQARHRRRGCASRGEMERFAPCTTSGVTTSHEQVCRLLALHGRPPVIALDGDQAGVEGTRHWLAGL